MSLIRNYIYDDFKSVCKIEHGRVQLVAMIRMLYRLFRYLYSEFRTEKIVLGRWGYHWDITKNTQKYYD